MKYTVVSPAVNGHPEAHRHGELTSSTLASWENESRVYYYLVRRVFISLLDHTTSVQSRDCSVNRQLQVFWIMLAPPEYPFPGRSQVFWIIHSWFG